MLQAIFYRSKEETLTGFQITGHAGYDEYGRDIVCAAVSALALNTANSLEALTEDTFSGEMGESGSLKVMVEEPSSDAELLLQSLLLGLTSVQEEYGEKHMKIRFEEV